MHHALHDRPRLPKGFSCAGVHCGLKTDGAEDLAIFVSETPAAAAAIFTRNHFPGAPVRLGRETIRSGRLQAIVANSKVSNVATGDEGLRRARRMGEAAARGLDLDPSLVLVSSTGVIGRQLPIEVIERGLRGVRERLHDDPLQAARGIMTTDTYPKAISCHLEGTTITLVAKGAGMIAPNMATMLVFAFTDAALDPETLDRVLRRAADRSFNLLSVDTDTSTSDTFVLLANGVAGPVPLDAFEGAFISLCEEMAECLARDGEGATKLIRATVQGALGRDQAKTIARSIAGSPLVKTMAYGGDPNVGRVLMAIGKCVDCDVRPERVEVAIGGVPVVSGGEVLAFDEAPVREHLRGDPVEIAVDLGLGEGKATAYGCDLTPGYVSENAAYYSS